MSKKLLKYLLDRYTPSFSVFLRQRKLISYTNRHHVKLSWGFYFAGDKLMETETFEPTEVQTIRNLLPAFDQFVNIGANIGFYCCHALSLGKPVIAFEPSARNISLLLKNIVLNKWQNQCDIYPIALSKEKGILQLYGDGTGASLVPNWGGVPKSFASFVPVNTLDTILGTELHGKKTLFLVDVEGAEFHMLQGAHLNLLDTSVWIVEISIDEHLPDGQKINPNLLDTFDIFWKKGFTAYTVETHPKKIHRNEIEEITHKKINKLNTHNFMFIGSSVESKIYSSISLEK